MPWRAALTACLCVALLSCHTHVTLGEWVEPTTGMKFVWLEPSAFVMGSSPDEVGREGQEQLHHVTLTRGIWIGAFEVTQSEWRRVMHTSPSWFNGEERLPVESVTLHEVQAYLERFSEMARPSRFRLPTEAEWEYACRAGRDASIGRPATAAPATANIAASPEQAAAGRSTVVGSYAPNAFGLYDMLGNVWEWTADEHCPYASAPSTDPRLRCGSPHHVIRGGSWRFDASSARCAVRYTHRPQDRGYSLGFRVVREPSLDASVG